MITPTRNCARWDTEAPTLHTQVSATLEEKEKGLEELEADVSAFSRSIMVMSFTIDKHLQTN